MGENIMKVNEIKDYLSEKKNDVKNYILDKKDSIKDGAKKAVATGLVVSTLLGGMTACDNNKYKNESEDLKNVASQVEDFYNKIIKEYKKIYEKDYAVFKENFSDLVIFNDSINDKYQMIFAGERSVHNATYEISKEQFDKLLALAIASGNENVDANENRIFIDRETLADSSLNHFVEQVLDCIDGKEATQYRLPDNWNEGLLEGDEYWGCSNDDIIEDKVLDGPGLDRFKDFILNDVEELRFGHYNVYEDEGAVYEDGRWVVHNPDGTTTGLLIVGGWIEGYRLKFVDNIDTDGDGIDDTRKYLKNEIYGNFDFDELFDEMPQILKMYEGDDNIRYENGEWIFNSEIVSDGKYVVFNEVLHKILNGSGTIIGLSSNYRTEPIQQEQSMEK